MRDFKHLDTPEGYSQKDKALNILRSYFYPRKTVYFLPERPDQGFPSSQGHISYVLCRLLGYRIMPEPHQYEKKSRRRYDVVFKFVKTTFSDPLPGNRFGVEHIINGEFTSISKRALNAAFEEVFGYVLGVVPTTYAGAIVVKSNLNGTNDGRVVEGPIAPAEVEAEKVYQKAIDNTVPGQDLVLDYQVPVHGDQIPLVYLKYRPTKARFLDESTYAVVKQPTEVFSESEIKKILQLARHMGMDYGEFDVLRDKEDGRIYVVDASQRSWNHPRGLKEPDRKRALAYMLQSFEQLIRKHARR